MSFISEVGECVAISVAVLEADNMPGKIELRALDPAMLTWTGKSVTPEALDVLAAGVSLFNEFRLPPKRLNRKLYESVNSTLESIGGKWDGKSHKFAYNYKPVLERLMLVGREPTRNPGAFFPTSIDSICKPQIEFLAGQLWGDWQQSNRPLRVLDPSAGTGNWLITALDVLPLIHGPIETIAIELDSVNVAELAGQAHDQVHQADFMDPSMTPDVIGGPVDLICINPPFQGQTWLKHILKARDWLTPRGAMIAVYPANGIRRSQASELRAWLGMHHASIDLLTAEESGFPIDVHVAQIRLSTPTELERDWEPCNGYPSGHCYRIMMHLSQDRDFHAAGKPGQEIEKYLERYWLQGVPTYWNERVKAQVIQELILLAK